VLNARSRTAINGGFTLIEVIVALALMSVTILLILSALQGARKSLGVITRVSDQADLYAVRRYLRDTIGSAWPLAASASIQHPFHGAAHRVSFISSYMPPGRHAGLYQTLIEVSPISRATQREFQLIITQRLVDSQRSRELTRRLPNDRTVLLTGLDMAEFAYFGRLDDGSVGRWTSNWDGPNGLPQLVRLQVRFSNSHQEHWYPFLVQLPLSD
jgi:general secretion pathway protein J